MLARGHRQIDAAVLGGAQRQRFAVDPRRLQLRASRQPDCLLTAARESGCEIVSIWPRRDTLEDLFLREIGAAPPEARGS